jgi:1,4-alpha-glucan branching enzyme
MRHAEWTPAATHAVLPLLATDAGVRLQVRSGIASHRRRSPLTWRGGFWLPECAYSPWLEPVLHESGVRTVCVERTAEVGFGSWENLRPSRTSSGVVLVPIDRETISLVWSDEGYPASGAYRDYHHHTTHHHNPWSNSGEAYDPVRGEALARTHAADFVARTIARLDRAAADAPDGALAGGGLVVCALDTELLGHWWYEGMTWLSAVVAEADAQGLELVRLDEAAQLADQSATGANGGEEGWQVSSWGAKGDLSTWSGPRVAEMAFAARAAELGVISAGSRVGERAVRELLALQASDWSFMVTREIATPYARERSAAHLAALETALREGPRAPLDGIRNLAVDADPHALFAP